MRLPKMKRCALYAHMSYVTKIVTAFGGTRPMARAMGRPISTVQSWKDRGSIPDEVKPFILAKAVSAGLNLTPADFFPVAPDFANHIPDATPGVAGVDVVDDGGRR
jgi:hypothetical protein